MGRFPDRDGALRDLREPDAVPIVQNGRLRMGVRRFTRSHDKVQIFDNAKHVMFSTRSFDVPETGVTFSWEMGAEGAGCAEDDLYDGFASLLVLDLSTGTAIDVFCRDDLCAAVFARLPFPGVSLPHLEPMKYWALFDEKRLGTGGLHGYSIAIRPDESSITWTVDGSELRRQTMPAYGLGPLMLGLGLMTEKDIGASGSISCHGQGIRAEWSPIEIAF
ncbi:MAG: DUF6081 family protein [Actinomycetota bacterium]